MERTFSLDARAVVPTTQGLTSAMPRAGSINTRATSTPSGMALRIGASQDAPRDPSKKYEQLRIRQAAGLLDVKIQTLVKIPRKRGEGGVIGESLEEFADVRDPEGTLEAGANLMQAFGKGH